MSRRLFLSSTWRTTRIFSRHISRVRSSPAPFPTIPSCPNPTCACAETPALPEGLKIDHNKPLNGTMAPYSEQILICTGQRDWKSRIEDENDGDNLAADLKELLGRGGIYSDVCLYFLLHAIQYFAHVHHCARTTKLIAVYDSHIIMFPSPTPPFRPQYHKERKYRLLPPIFFQVSNMYLSYHESHLIVFKHL
jgi:hypothetical protein